MSEAPALPQSSDDFERLYAGHGRGIVIAQPEPGHFTERPMTPAELIAREPAARLAGQIYELASEPAFAYIRLWRAIVAAENAAIGAAAKAHDRRVTELLAANNREVERRRVWQAMAIAAIRILLADFYTGEEAERWLASPHPLLDGATPLACIEAGGADALLDLIGSLRDSN